MASDFDRDNSIDALLRGARRDPARQEAGPACLDAETLAAWADGGLDADRVRAIEAHVADCARCQALSSAFFSSDETVAGGAPKVVPFRRNRVMYWLPIAAGTIAATLVIWIGVREKNEVVSEAQRTIAESRAAEPPAPAIEAARQANQGQQGASSLAVPRGDTTAPADAKRVQRKEGNAAPVDPRADRAKQEAATADQFRRVVPEPVASPAAKAAAPPPPAAMPPPPQPVLVPPITAQAPPPPPATAAAASPVRQSSVMRETVEPRIVAEFSSVLQQGQASTISGLPGTVGGVAGGGGGRGGRGGGGGGGRGAAILMDAAKPAAPPFYWRILSTDVIERSVDKLGWEPVAIDPPVRSLTSGAAPSATVCWIIGRAGLVLRTTDGKEFTRVTPPAPADLISITAQDALRASVTTAGGQTFTTTDGGKSWR